MGKRRKRKRSKPAPVIRLAPGIEERVALREAWSHKHFGTPETHEHAYQSSMRDGALARLHRTGAIDAHQLAAADRIADAHHALTADVAVRTVKWGPRGSASHDGAEREAIASVIQHQTYGAWREAVAPHAPMLLAIIVDDIGVTIAARRWRMSTRRARAILTRGLDQWGRRAR